MTTPQIHGGAQHSKHTQYCSV